MLEVRRSHFMRIVLLFLFIHSIKGKSAGLLEYTYQEILDGPNIPIIDESKYIEVDELSDETLEEICKNFKVTIVVKDTNSVIHCLGLSASSFEDTNHVEIVKREADFEGSGDDENQKIETSEAPSTEPTTSIDEGTTIPDTLTILMPSESTITEYSSTGVPTLFQNGFHQILNHLPSTTPKEDVIVPGKELEGNAIEEENGPMLKAGKSPASIANEISKTGESQENPSTASANNAFLIVFAVLGVIGTLAFAYNFIKKRRDKKAIDESIEVEQQGRELKEMKPLMKNGAKSLEFIDAEPQNGTEVQVEINERSSN